MIPFLSLAITSKAKHSSEMCKSINLIVIDSLTKTQTPPSLCCLDGQPYIIYNHLWYLILYVSSLVKEESKNVSEKHTTS